MKLIFYTVLFIISVIGTIYLFTNYKTMETNTMTTKSKTINEKNLKTAYFAWGCFWCMEWIFEAQEWVKEAVAWYAWWDKDLAKYDIVSTWTTKHREWVKVIYDPEIITYEKLVKLFWTQIDPTDPDWQFADKGFQYTTSIYYSNEEEKKIAEAEKENLEKSWKFDKK
jgi:peptide methionine sulfoxide reductase msrA/msrB